MWLNNIETHWQSWPRFARVALAILCGVVASLGQAPFGMPLVSLAGFVAGFALLTFSQSPSKAFRTGWQFGLGYFALTMQWLVSPFLVEAESHAWMAPFAVFFMAAGLALFWGAAFAVARRINTFALVVTLPLMELLRAYLFSGFPWGMPAYGTVDRVLGQGAAYVGSHGLNLVFLFIAACTFFAVRGGSRRVLASAGAVLGLALLWPLPDAPAVPEPGMGTIRLIQPNAPQHQKWDPDFMPIIFDRALALTASEGSPDLIVWPETSLPSILSRGEPSIQEISKAAGDAPVFFGANRLENLMFFNAAVLMDGQGVLGQTYDKHHLVPFGEYIPFGELLSRFGIHGMAASQGQGFTPGSGPKLIDLGPLGRALPLICYEAVFPQDVSAAPERPDFLLQITNDAWFGTFSGPHQHLVQSRMRSIEHGLPMVRAANTGISALIDEKGRVLKALPLNEAGFLDVELPKPAPATLYSNTGDLPIGLILTCALLGLWIRRHRNSN